MKEKKIKNWFRKNNAKYYGFDTEGHNYGVIQLIQICNRKNVLLIYAGAKLDNFLSHMLNKIKKYGVGLRKDIQLLRRIMTGVKLNRTKFIELQDKFPEKMSMERIASKLFGKKYVKPKGDFYDGEWIPLTREKKLYSVMDAYMSWKIATYIY